LYRQVVGRYRWPAFLLAVGLIALWLGLDRGMIDLLPNASSPGLLLGAIVAGSLWLFSLLAPLWAYAQPRGDHLRVQTPFYRLNIPYRYVQGTRPLDMRKAFASKRLRGAKARMVRRFGRHTGLAVDLTELPKGSALLSLFFHPLFLSPDRPGLILMVRDWKKLSRQITTHLDTWRTSHQGPRHAAPSDASTILGQ
jgi:hypothetical protein